LRAAGPPQVLRNRADTTSCRRRPCSGPTAGPDGARLRSRPWCRKRALRAGGADARFIPRAEPGIGPSRRQVREALGCRAVGCLIRLGGSGMRRARGCRGRKPAGGLPAAGGLGAARRVIGHDEPVLVGDNHGLYLVPECGLHQDPAYVRLDGAYLDDQLRGDRVVGQAARPAAARQAPAATVPSAARAAARRPYCLGEPADQPRLVIGRFDQRVAGRDAPALAARPSAGTARAHLQRFKDILIGVGGRENQYPAVAAARDLPGCLTGQDDAEASPDQPLVVGDEDRDAVAAGAAAELGVLVTARIAFRGSATGHRSPMSWDHHPSAG